MVLSNAGASEGNSSLPAPPGKRATMNESSPAHVASLNLDRLRRRTFIVTTRMKIASPVFDRAGNFQLIFNHIRQKTQVDFLRLQVICAAMNENSPTHVASVNLCRLSAADFHGKPSCAHM